MNRLVRALPLSLVLLVMTSASLVTAAAPGLAGHPGLESSPDWQARVDGAVARTVTAFAGRSLRPDQLAVTVVDLSDPAAPRFSSHRGSELIYPASVVKMFYLAAVHRWLEDGRLTDTPELRRAMRDMMVDSYNEPTHYLIDLLTGTTSGPELSEDALWAWWDQRNAVNRYFASLGYPGINVNKKPWCEGPYGRESQAIARFTPKRNFLSTDATARLMYEIVTGGAVSADRSRQMMELMVRDVFGEVRDRDDQTHGFTGIALLEPRMTDARLWSKAGWTSQTRHDAAYVELPDGRRLILVVFTVDHAYEREILPTVVRNLLKSP